MTVIESAVQWAIRTANDNSHGYSQRDRWGPDYDCSSFVIEAYEQAGVPVKQAGAMNTGNMWKAFVSCGFADVTTQVGLSSGYGIEAGDVLLNYASHTCIAIGNGRVANCRSSEGNDQAGDQSGNEIRLQNYWNYPWNAVLRYKGKAQNSAHKDEKPPVSAGNSQDLSLEDHRLTLPLLTPSNAYSSYCVLLQAVLNCRHFACGSADGFYGAKTQAAVTKAQRYFGIEVDGKCGKETWAKLLERE